MYEPAGPYIRTEFVCLSLLAYMLNTYVPGLRPPLHMDWICKKWESSLSKCYEMFCSSLVTCRCQRKSIPKVNSALRQGTKITQLFGLLI
jgi:hypothetical protein